LRRHASIATRLTSGDEWPKRPSCRGGLTSLNHKFAISERTIFLRGALDPSGKTGGVFLNIFASRHIGNTLIDCRRHFGPRFEGDAIVQNGHFPSRRRADALLRRACADD
jgi:hypothetical protein